VFEAAGGSVSVTSDTTEVGVAAGSVSVGEGGAGGVPQPARTRVNRRSAVKQSRSFFIVDFPVPRIVEMNQKFIRVRRHFVIK
jgi:hypothetical protein